VRGVLAPVIVTYAYICSFTRSSKAHASPSQHVKCSPTQSVDCLGFGGRFYARLLSAPERSTSELLRTL